MPSQDPQDQPHKHPSRVDLRASILKATRILKRLSDLPRNPANRTFADLLGESQPLIANIMTGTGNHLNNGDRRTELMRKITRLTAGLNLLKIHKENFTTRPVRMGPWFATPIAFARLPGYLSNRLLKHMDVKKPPIIYSSPVELGTLLTVLRLTLKALNNEQVLENEYSLKTVIKEIRLKTMVPALWRWLEKKSLFEGKWTDYIENGQHIMDLASQDSHTPFHPYKPEKNEANGWMYVHSNWNGFPKFHSFYVDGADWMHVGLWTADDHGSLRAWEMQSFVLERKRHKKAFDAYKDAITSNLPPKKDWESELPS